MDSATPVIKSSSENSKTGDAPKKSRLGRKSLGEYFAHSPLPFRRTSLFPKTSAPVATPPLKTRRTLALFNGITANLLSSPEDELPSPIPEEVEPFEFLEFQTPAKPKILLGNSEKERKILSEDGLRSGFLF